MSVRASACPGLLHLHVPPEEGGDVEVLAVDDGGFALLEAAAGDGLELHLLLLGLDGLGSGLFGAGGARWLRLGGGFGEKWGRFGGDRDGFGWGGGFDQDWLRLQLGLGFRYRPALRRTNDSGSGVRGARITGSGAGAAVRTGAGGGLATTGISTRCAGRGRGSTTGAGASPCRALRMVTLIFWPSDGSTAEPKSRRVWSLM